MGGLTVRVMVAMWFGCGGYGFFFFYVSSILNAACFGDRFA